MKKLELHSDWTLLRLRVGERVELFGRIWVYAESRRKDGSVERSLEPV